MARYKNWTCNVFFLEKESSLCTVVLFLLNAFDLHLPLQIQTFLKLGGRCTRVYTSHPLYVSSSSCENNH